MTTIHGCVDAESVIIGGVDETDEVEIWQHEDPLGSSIFDETKMFDGPLENCIQATVSSKRFSVNGVWDERTSSYKYVAPKIINTTFVAWGSQFWGVAMRGGDVAPRSLFVDIDSGHINLGEYFTQLRAACVGIPLGVFCRYPDGSIEYIDQRIVDLPRTVVAHQSAVLYARYNGTVTFEILGYYEGVGTPEGMRIDGEISSNFLMPRIISLAGKFSMITIEDMQTVVGISSPCAFGLLWGDNTVVFSSGNITWDSPPIRGVIATHCPNKKIAFVFNSTDPTSYNIDHSTMPQRSNASLKITVDDSMDAPGNTDVGDWSPVTGIVEWYKLVPSMVPLTPDLILHNNGFGGLEVPGNGTKYNPIPYECAPNITMVATRPHYKCIDCITRVDITTSLFIVLFFC